MEKPLRVQNRTQGTAYSEEEKEKNKEEGWGEEKYSLQNLRSVCHTSSSSLGAIQVLVWMQLNRHRTNLYSFSFFLMVCSSLFPCLLFAYSHLCCLEHGLPCPSSSLTATLLLVLFLSLSWNTLFLQCKPGTSWPPAALPLANFIEYLYQVLARGPGRQKQKFRETSHYLSSYVKAESHISVSPPHFYGQRAVWCPEFQEWSENVAGVQVDFRLRSQLEQNGLWINRWARRL